MNLQKLYQNNKGIIDGACALGVGTLTSLFIYKILSDKIGTKPVKIIEAVINNEEEEHEV